jgi:hypothetical protein
VAVEAAAVVVVIAAIEAAVVTVVDAVHAGKTSPIVLCKFAL